MNQLPGSPRRADVRLTLCREVRVKLGPSADFVTLRTVNISRRGMLVRAVAPPVVGTRVEVILPDAEGGALQLVGAVVRIVRPPPGEDLFQVGIALEPREGQQQKLDRYLAACPGRSQDERLPEIPHERRSSQAPEEPETRGWKKKPATLAKIQLRRVATGLTGAKPSLDPVLGIDLGTTTCVACVIEDDKLTVIRDDDGRAAIPSVVWIRGHDDHVAGYRAAEAAPLEPIRTVGGAMRLLGCRAVDRDVVQYLLSVNCPVKPVADQGVCFVIDGETFSPVRIASIVLRHVKACAERMLKRPVRKAVLTYPMAAGTEGRADYKEAARLAGLEPVAVIPDAGAVGLAYGCGRDEKTVGVYDMGGGTFTFSVVECAGSVFRIRGLSADPWLGGEGMDVALARAGAEEFWRVAQVDLRQRVVEWRRVLMASEEAKRILSQADSVELHVPRAAVTSQGEIDLCVPLTRQWFDELTTDLVVNSWRVVQRGLAEAKVQKDQLSELILVGGATMVPAVRSSAKVLFGREPQRSAHPDRAAAIGASLKAVALRGGSLPPGPWPDLIARQAVEQTIGLAMAGGVTEPLIARSRELPAVKRRVFATFRDDQTRLAVQIVTGEARETASNRVVGTVLVTDLPAGPAGSAEVEVKFEMHDRDTLSVRTRVLSNGSATWTSFSLPSEL